MTHTRVFTVLSVAPLLACGGGGQNAAASESDVVEAMITAPADGAELTGPVTIRLGTRNLTIRPAGTDEPNSGHHHLFINSDIVPEGEVILTGPGIVHLGAGQSEYVIDETGTYTVIAVLGDHRHARIPGATTDTVQFTVQ